MALDLAALRAKLGELKGGTARTEVLWKPIEGENHIRILPLATNPENPFTELYFHYLGNKTHLSSLSFGENDPIADFAENLRAGGGLTKEEWRDTKKFVPQIRTFVPVIDRKHPELGVRFWAFGKTVYQEILGSMADPDYGDITDVQVGRDIKVTFTPQDKSPTGFAQTSIRVSPKETPLTKDADQLKSWLTDQPDLMSIYKRLSYDELKDILDKFIGGDVPVQAPTARTSKKSVSDDWDEPDASPTATKSRSGVKKTAVDVEEEFANLFEQ